MGLGYQRASSTDQTRHWLVSRPECGAPMAPIASVCGMTLLRQQRRPIPTRAPCIAGSSRPCARALRALRPLPLETGVGTESRVVAGKERGVGRLRDAPRPPAAARGPNLALVEAPLEAPTPHQRVASDGRAGWRAELACQKPVGLRKTMPPCNKDLSFSRTHVTHGIQL